jgi:hypothetical protein
MGRQQVVRQQVVRRLPSATPLFEQLENRQLLALTVDVRLPGGGKTQEVTKVGDVVNLEVWATVTGSDSNVTNEGLQIAVGSLLSTDVSGGAARGTLKATLLSPFTASGSDSGAQADLDGDGDLDVGSNDNANAAGFLFARSSAPEFDGTAVTKGQAFKIATATFTVTQLLNGTGTDLTYRIRPTSNGFLYVQDGQSASSLTGATFTAGTGVRITSPGIGGNTIRGRVFNDKNANGIFDGDDTGISGFRVFLDKDFDGILDAGEISKPVSTTGTYTFSDVPNGTYRVREVFRDGWRQSFPALGYYEVTLRGGETAKTQSFANTDTIVIKGKVWMDSNVNKFIDAAEGGLPGWMLYLDHNNNGKLDKGDDWALSDANGNYRFFNLPAGKYVVRIVQQSGYKQTAPAGGSHTITLGAGQTTSNKNFGEKRLK